MPIKLQPPRGREHTATGSWACWRRRLSGELLSQAEKEVCQGLIVRGDCRDIGVFAGAVLAVTTDAEGDRRDSVHAVEAQVPGAVFTDELSGVSVAAGGCL